MTLTVAGSYVRKWSKLWPEVSLRLTHTVTRGCDRNWVYGWPEVDTLCDRKLTRSVTGSQPKAGSRKAILKVRMLPEVYIDYVSFAEYLPFFYCIPRYCTNSGPFSWRSHFSGTFLEIKWVLFLSLLASVKISILWIWIESFLNL